MPLTPDSSPPVDPTFTPQRDHPSAYRTSGWEAKDKRWKGWPAVIIGVLVAGLVVGANYQTKRKAEEREAVAAAQAEATPPATAATEPTTTTPDTTAQAPASPATTPPPEQIIKESPTAAGPAATPKREPARAPVATKERHESVAVAPAARDVPTPAPELKPAEPIVSVPTPAPTPAASAPQPIPAPAPQPEQQPPSQ